jgi:hypothetical protein
MWAKLSFRLTPSSITTLRQFTFRLAVIIVSGLVWFGPSPATAIAVLSFALGAGSLVRAYTFDERIAEPSLNRWHEGGELLLIAIPLFLAR